MHSSNNAISSHLNYCLPAAANTFLAPNLKSYIPELAVDRTGLSADLGIKYNTNEHVNEVTGQ